MGLFSFFNRKNGYQNGASLNGNANVALPEIPEGVFIEKETQDEERQSDKNGSSPENGINVLFQFLDLNYESKGYDDSLVNPDTIHLEQNSNALKNDLERTIRKVKTYYEDLIREIDFHIVTRSKSGMIDTVEELKVKKVTAEAHIKQVIEIEEEGRNGKGPAQGIVISYTKGFKNGLAAISHHSILKRKF